jgi:YHS domain-containing protein
MRQICNALVVGKDGTCEMSCKNMATHHMYDERGKCHWWFCPEHWKEFWVEKKKAWINST